MTYTYKKCWDSMLSQEASCILRNEDGALIPTVPGNRDYDEYLEWLAEGNTPEPAEEATE